MCPSGVGLLLRDFRLTDDCGTDSRAQHMTGDRRQSARLSNNFTRNKKRERERASPNCSCSRDARRRERVYFGHPFVEGLGDARSSRLPFIDWDIPEMDIHLDLRQ